MSRLEDLEVLLARVRAALHFDAARASCVVQAHGTGMVAGLLPR